MPHVFLLSQHSHQKLLKFIQKKLHQEGLECEILKSPKTSMQKVKECFKLYSANMPRIKPLNIAEQILDPEEYTLKNENKITRLRKKEFQLLKFLIENKNQIIDRNAILENVWGHDSNPFTNTVDVHIATLRKKLKTNEKIKIKTVHGVGYKLEVKEKENSTPDFFIP